MLSLKFKNFLILFLLIILIGAFFTYFQIRKKSSLVEKKEIPSQEEILEEKKPAKFSISGGKGYPVFEKELVVDPAEIKVGEKQRFSIWAKDLDGIEKVSLKIETEKGEREIEFILIEGDEKEGRWESFWIAEDVLAGKIYPATFLAKNKKGEETKLPFHFETK